MTELQILFTALIIVMLVAGLIYNSLIMKKNQVKNSYSSIDAMLKKRYDLIPNLVSSVQSYMKHEAGTLKEITALRAKAVSGELSPNEKISLENQMGKMLGGVMVAVENYPKLKANENFLQLQSALNEIEEQLSAARRAYNAAVMSYNNGREMFPSNLIAGMMKLEDWAFFEIEQAERANVNVGNLFGN